MIFDNNILIIILGFGIFVLFSLIGYSVEIYKKSKDSNKTENNVDRSILTDNESNISAADNLLDDRDNKS